MILFTLATACWATAAHAAEERKVLRADSPHIDVQDGPRLWKGLWTADPTVELDTYNAARSDKPKTITFISDIDRLSFDVEPNKAYEFEVLLKGKDRCRTRLSTMVQPFKRITPGPGPVSVPFTLDRGVISVKVRVNGSEPLDLLFDTGADATVIHTSAQAKGGSVTVDGTQAHLGFGGTTISQSASDNTIELAGIRWEREPVIWSDHQGFGGNGLLGAHVFEDKVVEIDFDRRVLLLHDTLPTSAAGRAVVPMLGAGRTFAVDCVLGGGATDGSGRAFFDTGFPGALLVYADLDTALGLRKSLSRVGRSSTSGTGRGAVECDIMLLPTLSLAGTTMKRVPIHVEAPADGKGSGYSGAVIGMDVLKRFNVILDYPRDTAYLASNGLLATPYAIVVPGTPWGIIIALATAIVTALAAFTFFRRSTASAGSAT